MYCLWCGNDAGSLCLVIDTKHDEPYTPGLIMAKDKCLRNQPVGFVNICALHKVTLARLDPEWILNAFNGATS